MKKIILICFFSTIYGIGLSQEKLILNNGTSYDGKLLQLNDSLVLFETKINNKFMELNLPRAMVKEIKIKKDEDEDNRRVVVVLKDYKKITGILIRESDKEIELANTKLTKEILIINKSRILKIFESKPKTTFVEIGFLKGGSLVGAELDFALSERTSMFLGVGYVGFGGGFNMFFNKNYTGAGIKFAYSHFGFGDSFAGSVAGFSLFYKMSPGLSIDVGLGKPLARGNFDLGGYDYILTYSIGARF